MSKRKIICLAVVLVMAAMMLCACQEEVVTVDMTYRQAQELLAAGDYQSAMTAFEALASYEESSRLAVYCRAHVEARNGNYELAGRSMQALGDFRDAELQAQYFTAMHLMEIGRTDTECFDAAGEIFASLGVFRNSDTVSVPEMVYEDAEAALLDAHFDEAGDMYAYLQDYKDSRELYAYACARDSEAAGEYTEAMTLYEDIIEVRDSNVRFETMKTAIYDSTLAALDQNDLHKASEFMAFMKNEDAFAAYEDIPTMETYLQARSLEEFSEGNIENYVQAAGIYMTLGDYRDSAARAESIPETIYTDALEALEAGDFQTATLLFSYQPDYLDTPDMLPYVAAREKEAAAVDALNALRQGIDSGYATYDDVYAVWDSSVAAQEAYGALGEFRDSAVRADASFNILYRYTDELAQQGDYFLAGDILNIVGWNDWIPQADYLYALGYYHEETEEDKDRIYNLWNAKRRFELQSDYQDSAQMALNCLEEIGGIGENALKNGDYDTAIDAFSRLPEEMDGKNLIAYVNARKDESGAAADPGLFVSAAGQYDELADFRDSALRAESCRAQLFAMAESARVNGDYVLAQEYYSYQPDYKDGDKYAVYVTAMAREASAAFCHEDYLEAAKIYDSLGEFSDSAQQAENCRKMLFDLAESARAEGRYSDAYTLYNYQPEYNDGGNYAIYVSALNAAANASTDPAQYLEAAKLYDSLGEFSDSARQAENCRASLFALAEQAFADGEYSAAATLYNHQPDYKDGGKLSVYAAAMGEESAGASEPARYLTAADLFDSLGEFKDSAQRAVQARQSSYNVALSMMESGEYLMAAEAFALLTEYSDSANISSYCIARDLDVNGKYDQAIEAYESLGDFRDCRALSAAAKETAYAKGLASYEAGNYAEAVIFFEMIGDYSDAAQFAVYAAAEKAEKTGISGDMKALGEALTMYDSIPDFRASSARSSAIGSYIAGYEAMNKAQYGEANQAFSAASGYMDSAQLAAYTLARANEQKGDSGDNNGYIAAADQYEALNGYLDSADRALRLRNKLMILFADEVRKECYGLRAVKRNGQWGFADKNDELVSDFKWDECGDFTSDGTALVKKDGLYGYIDSDGNLICALEYKMAYDFSEGFGRVRMANDRWNYINKSGKLLSSYSSWYDAKDFHQGRAAVNTDDYDEEWRYINARGESVTSYLMTFANGDYGYVLSADDFKDGFAKVGYASRSWASKPERYAYLSLAGEYISDSEPQKVGNYWKISRNGKVGFINSKGDIVTFAGNLEFVNGYCLTSKERKYGMIREDGTTVTDNIWDDIHHFSEERALVKDGNYYGFIDLSGSTAVPVQYNDALDFSGGLAMVKLNGACGYVDHNGNVVIPLIYDDAKSFENGMAKVLRYGQWIYIDPNGTILDDVPVEEVPETVGEMPAESAAAEVISISPEAEEILNEGMEDMLEWWGIDIGDGTITPEWFSEIVAEVFGADLSAADLCVLAEACDSVEWFEEVVFMLVEEPEYGVNLLAEMGIELP